MNKQTAVEWLIEQLEPAIALQSKIIQEYAEQANKMFEEQITDAYEEGWSCTHGKGFPETGEQYYNQTFKSDK